MSFTEKWIELDTIMLSKISQIQKEIRCIFSHVQTLKLKINNETDISIQRGL
jgi:hypothetical protein